MIAAQDAVEPAPLRIGFHARFDPEWHFYWRSAGETGLPPRFDWSQSKNVARVEILWPLPERYNLGGFEALGYSDEVVLPMTVVPRDSARAVEIRVNAIFATCKDVCAIHDETFVLNLPPGVGLRTPYAGLIDTYAARVPVHDAGGLTIEALRLAGPAAARVLEFHARSNSPWRNADAFVEGPEGFIFLRPAIAIGRAEYDARFRIPVRGRAEWPRGAAVVITLSNGSDAIERRLIPSRTE